MICPGRELAKLEVLANALAEALLARGIAESPARLAAHAGMAAFARATVAWLAAPDPALDKRLDEVFEDLRSLLNPAAA